MDICYLLHLRSTAYDSPFTIWGKTRARLDSSSLFNYLTRARARGKFHYSQTSTISVKLYCPFRQAVLRVPSSCFARSVKLYCAFRQVDLRVPSSCIACSVKLNCAFCQVDLRTPAKCKAHSVNACVIRLTRLRVA